MQVQATSEDRVRKKIRLCFPGALILLGVVDLKQLMEYIINIREC